MSRAEVRQGNRTAGKKGDTQRRSHQRMKSHDGMKANRMVYGKMLFGGSAGTRKANGL